MNSPSMRQIREAIVRKHIESENHHQFTATVDTFAQPRYEVVPTGEVHDGPAAVFAFLAETHSAFSDFHFELGALHQADNAVLVEVTFMGTHDGAWRGLPATGRLVRYRMCNVFVFEGDRLVCERLYFDLSTILRQLGIARDPTTIGGRVEAALTHPVTIGRAFLRALRFRPSTR
jgi:steroid delta-isomerase-like uncharacterized protein